MPRDAYESDTGERDTPTHTDFINNAPVARRIGSVHGGGRKALHRRGRAIARIMYSQGRTLTGIARIFGVNIKVIRRVVKLPHVHCPKDELPNDYDYAGDGFKTAFPPLTTSEKPGCVDTCSSSSENDSDEVASSAGVGCKRKKSQANISTAKKVKRRQPTPYHSHAFDAYDSDSSLSEPPASPPPGPSTPRKRRLPLPKHGAIQTYHASLLADVLKSMLGLDPVLNMTTPAHIALFEARGFTVARLHAMSRWAASDISEALRRLLSNKVDNHINLDVFEVVMLELALTKLEAPTTSTPPVKSLSDALSLVEYLRNVNGFDLAGHAQLLGTNGFTLERLRHLSSMASDSPQMVYEVLFRALQAGSPFVEGGSGSQSPGITPIEIIALEFSLRSHIGPIS
ncbi:F-box domain-containing protein [Mycena indigotica]|uniref:F-box domain-containing protein n=1 Tax=Mycena indigotica TaxID=2126181 RepID=A0A8H6W8U7_9AGAR|nr:F-box domain-containing protein [Mycena indigotica]KAF7303504.1 F-box domain-containing protein [Mycena indigotica]